MSLNRSSVLLLVVIFIACLMDGLDGSIVNVALPTIAGVFDTDIGTVSWVALAYLMAVASTIFLFGPLASRGWLKQLFIAGFILFTVASVVCGFSPTLPVLIIARLAEGLGAAMMVSCAPIICVKYLPSDMLGLSFGLMAAATSVGFALGPALGGVLTHLLSWHWIFWINIPIGIFGVLFACKAVPSRASVFEPANRQPFDLSGALALLICIASATVFLERMPQLGGLHPLILVCAVAFVVSLIYFIRHSLKIAHPVLNIRLFRLRPVTCIVIAYLILQVVISGIIYLLPFYFTNQFGVDTLICGLLMLIQPLITALLGTSFGRWSDRYGRRRFCVISSAAVVVLTAIFAFVSPSVGLIPFIVTLVGFGVFLAMAFGPMSSQIVDQMPAGERETGSTLTLAIVYIAAVIGTALFAALFTLVTGDGGSVPSFADLTPSLFLSGFQVAMGSGVILMAAATVLAAAVRNRR